MNFGKSSKSCACKCTDCCFIMEFMLPFLLQNLLSDISKKEADLNNISKHSQLYQQAIKVSII